MKWKHFTLAYTNVILFLTRYPLLMDTVTHQCHLIIVNDLLVVQNICNTLHYKDVLQLLSHHHCLIKTSMIWYYNDFCNSEKVYISDLSGDQLDS